MQPLLAFLFGIALLVSEAGAATISFSFTSSLLTGRPGQTLTFSATLGNPGATNVFLNGDAVNIQAPLIVDDTKFFLNTPVFLAPGQSVTAPIVDVTVPGTASFKLYTGTFAVLGGSSPSELSTLASQPFAVNVVPEPSTGMMMTALLVLGSLASGLRRAAPFRRR
jgi:hypothetical protein